MLLYYIYIYVYLSSDKHDTPSIILPFISQYHFPSMIPTKEKNNNHLATNKKDSLYKLNMFFT